MSTLSAETMSCGPYEEAGLVAALEVLLLVFEAVDPADEPEVAELAGVPVTGAVFEAVEPLELVEAVAAADAADAGEVLESPAPAASAG
jgi:hypothetical protein